MSKPQDGHGRMAAISAGLVVIGLFVVVVTFGWVNVHPTEVAVEINKVLGRVSDMPKGVGSLLQSVGHRHGDL